MPDHADNPSRADRKAGSAARAVEILGSIVAPSSLLTALLYFFGWVRTGAFFGYFGIDRSLLHLSTEDYLLRTPELALRPLVAVALLLAALSIVHRQLDRRPTSSITRRGAAGLRLASLILIGVGAVGLFNPGHALPPLSSALALCLGSATAAATMIGQAPQADDIHRPVTRPQRYIMRIPLLGVAVLGAFWAESVYAQHAGARLAEYTATTPSSRPAAVIYSKERLQISGPGVQVATLPAASAKYQFRYTGLRLLAFADGRWILLPEGWRRGNGATAILLPDEATIRVDFQPPLT
jgi:hypothetical protein